MAVEVYKIDVMTENLSRLTMDMGYCAYAEVDRKWRGKQVCSPLNKIYIPEEGGGVIIAGGETVVMRPGMAYLLPVGLPVDFHCPDSLRKYFFHLNLYKPDRYDLFLGMKQIGQLPFSEEQLQTLKRCLHGSNYVDLLSVKQQLYRLLLEFATAYLSTGEAIPVYSAHVMDTIGYIHRNLSIKLRLNELAARLFVSRSFLSQRFRREVGVTVGQYITDQIMMEAQKRLSQTRDSVGAISHALGFDDQCYFSRRFKQICGVAPLQYRSKMKT